MSARRSRRSTLRSLVELEKRASEAAPLFGEDALDDSDDQSFDADRLSDDGEDIVDSDFDEPEEAPTDEAGQAEKAARQAERKRKRPGKYVDPAIKGRRAQGSARPVQRRSKSADVEPAAIHRSSLRRSTKLASVRAAEERERRMADEEERRKRKMMKAAEKPQVKILTQEELLEEAKETEVKNRESLKELLRLEEEKKRLPVVKKKEGGDVMSVRSAGGKQTVSFTRKEVDARKEMFPHLY
eukprot:GFKZ01010881.1.p1 GENE.GFKZ01010881.1~~GFKZ01010881.1.p1  ORF type:complete len:242 (-),score=70.21 GFKZ01010881.1:1262-1987(-)